MHSVRLDSLNVCHFPDGHKHLKINPDGVWTKTEVVASIRSFDDLFLLAQLKEIAPHLGILTINYLLAARCDWRFSEGEAIDLKIVGDFINSLGFNKVFILKPHSPAAMIAIKNSRACDITVQLLAQCAAEAGDYYDVVAPDAGASKWVAEYANPPQHSLVQGVKTRKDGRVYIQVSEVYCPTRPHIIIDDLCDGGATFIEMAKSLRERGVQKVYLVVTHGIFSKGIEPFEGVIDRIYCTDSFKKVDHPLVRQIGV